MNVSEFIQNRGKKEEPNPQYNPKSKKNNVSPTLIVDDLHPSLNPLVDVAKADLQNQQYIDAEEVEKYNRFGLNWSPKEMENGNLDRQLADAQSNWSKLFNMLGQTVVSELALGTIEGFSNIFDFVTSNILGITDDDYQNPVSELMAKWQDTFRNEIAPIYTDPNLNIQNGGLKDFGWWIKGIPNVASSLTLLIPARAISKGVSLLGKAARVDKLAYKAKKWVNSTEKLEKANELNAIQKALNNPVTREKLNLFKQNAFDAVLMRTMENYQESSDVYKQMEDDSNDTFSKMSDEEFTEWVNNNRGLLDEDVDISSRKEVAKNIAKKAADRTFAMDFSNVIFDIIQLYGLRNIGKGITQFSPKGGGALVQAEQKASIAGAAEIGGVANAVENATLKGFKKFSANARAFARHNAGIVLRESTEGIEEAVNYIAQQEGLTYGKALLDGKDDEYKVTNLPTAVNMLALGLPGAINVFNTWNKLQNPLGDYLKNAELQESAFWGFFGGIAFGAGGSFMNRVSLARNRKKLEKELTVEDPNTHEKINLSDEHKNLLELLELPEQQAARIAIKKRNTELQDLKSKIFDIREGYDVFSDVDETGKKPKTLLTEEAQQIAINRVIADYQSNLVQDAINSGTYNLLLDYWKSDGSKKAMKVILSQNQENPISDAEVETYVNNFVTQAEHIKQLSDNISAKVISQFKYYNANAKYGEDVSLRYAQAIAKQKLDRTLEAESVKAEMDALEEIISGKENWESIADEDFVNIKLKERDRIRLRHLVEFYSVLEAQKRKLNNIKNKDWNTLKQIKNIEKQQNVIVKELNKTNILGTENNAGASAVAAAIMRSDLIEEVITTTGQLDYRFNNNNSVRTDDEIVSTVEKLLNTKIENKDTLLHQARIFANDSKVNKNYKDELKSRNYDLWERYNKYERLNLIHNMLITDAEINADTIKDDIDLMHNRNNSARKQLIKEVGDTITNIVKRVVKNDTDVNDFVNNVVIPATEGRLEDTKEYLNNLVGEEDSAKIVKSLELINFGNKANANIYDYLVNIIQYASIVESQSGNNTTPVEEEEEINDGEEETLAEEEETGETQDEVLETGEEDETKRQQEVQTRTQKEPKQPIGQSPTKPISPVNNGNDNGKPVEDSNIETLKAETNPTYNVGETAIPTINIPIELSTPIHRGVRAKFAEIVSEHETLTDDVIDDAIPEVIEELKTINSSVNLGLTDEQINKYVDDISDIFYEAAKLIKNNDNPAKTQAVLLAAFANTAYASKGDEIQTPKFVEAFGNVAEKFFNEYDKIVHLGIDKNGKTIINMQDILTICNRLYKASDATMASSLYNLIYNYVTTGKGSLKYSIEDLGKGKNQILRHSFLTDEQIRQTELDTNSFNDRVDINTFINMYKGQDTPEAKQYFETLDSLKIGDTLDIDVIINNGHREEIRLLKDDVVVGRLPIPTVIGSYYVTNDGWVHDLDLDANGNVISRCKDVIEGLLLGRNINKTEYDNLINILNKYNLSSVADNDQLIKDFLNIPTINTLIQNEITKRNNFLKSLGVNSTAKIDPNAVLFINDKTGTIDANRVLGFLARLYKYSTVNAKGLDHNANLKNIEDNLNYWFKSRYNTYDKIWNFGNNFNGQNVKARITKLNDGQIAKIYDDHEDDEHNIPKVFEHYDELTYPSESIVDRAKSRLTFVGKNGRTITSGFGTYNSPEWQEGNTMLTTFDRNGHPHHVRAVGVMINDHMSKKSYDVLMAIQNNIMGAIIKLNQNKGSIVSKNELLQTLNNVFTTKNNNYGLLRAKSGFIQIGQFSQDEIKNGFDGIAISYINNINGNILNVATLKIYTKTKAGDGLGISLVGPDGKYIKLDTYGYNNIVQIEKQDKYSKQLFSDKDVYTAIQKGLNHLYSLSTINISSLGLSSDNKGSQLSGFFSRDESGVTLSIPQRDGLVFTRKAASYNDLLIDNDLVKVNLKKINGKNFENRGSEQQLNQILYVSLPNLLNDNTIDEVEDTDDRDVLEVTTYKPTRDKVKEIIDTNKVTSGIELLDVVLGEGTLQRFKDAFENEDDANSLLSVLFPGNITYVPELNLYDNQTGESKGANAYTRGANTGTIQYSVIDKNGNFKSRTMKSNEVVIIGPRLLNWLSDVNINVRKKGVRKLIHEQLHSIIQQDSNKYKKLLEVSKQVYNITYDTLKKQIRDEENPFKKNKLKEIKTVFDLSLKGYQENTNRLYEEFLVETLTNKTFIDYLNSIEVENETKTEKETLFTKIMKAIARFFGWEIKDNTLLAKEFNMLANIIDTTTPVGENKQSRTIDVDERFEDENSLDESVSSDPRNGQVEIQTTKEFEETSKKIDDYITWSNNHTKKDDSHIYHYYDDEGLDTPIDISVTQYSEQLLNISSTFDEETWSFASRLGNSIDEITRDFYLNGEKYVRTTSYPNINTKRKNLIINQLKRFTEYLNKTYPKGYKVITNEFTLLSKINTPEGVKTIAGTMDMLVIDNEGNLHIYDMKNKRRTNMTKEDEDKYTFQLNVYRQMLEQTFPEFKGKIKDHHLIWFNQKYPTPNDKVSYEVDDDTSEISVRNLSTGEVTPMYKFKDWFTPAFEDDINNSIKELDYSDKLQNLTPFFDNMSEETNQSNIKLDDEEVELDFSAINLLNDDDIKDAEASQGDELQFDYTFINVSNIDSFKNSLPLNLQDKFDILKNDGEIELICK